MTTWTECVVQSAEIMWQSGESSTDIAAKLKLTRNQVLGFMHRNKDKFPPRVSYNSWEKELPKIEEMWKEGVSARLIATALGHTEGQVAGIIRRNRDKFPSRRTGRSAAKVNADTIKASKSPKNSKLSIFNVNAGVKTVGYESPELDSFELSRLPGVTLVDNDGCMYPLTEASPHMFCGCSRSLSSRYCEYHVAKTTGYRGIDISYRKSYDKNIAREEAA